MPRTANAGACDKAQFAVLDMFVEEQGLIRTFVQCRCLIWPGEGRGGEVRVGATPFFPLCLMLCLRHRTVVAVTSEDSLWRWLEQNLALVCKR